MVVAAIAGILFGALSIIPFGVSTKKIRTVDPSQSLNLLGPFLLTIALSFVVLIAGLLACKFIAPDYVIAFAIAEFVAFAVGVIVFGLILSKRR